MLKTNQMNEYVFEHNKRKVRKEKLKMKNIKKVIIVLLCFCILILCLIGGQSFSKYIMQVQGRGIIQVAKWNFLVNGQSSQMANISLVNTCQESSVLKNCIAPGTRGAFDIVIDAKGSQTEIAYQIKFENESGKPTNLRFSCEGIDTSSLQELENNLRGKIEADTEEKVKTYTILWYWNYETGNTPEEIKRNDEIDTKEARSIQDYTFDVLVVGIQEEPKEA